MKWIRPFFFFLFCVLLAATVLSLLMPTHQKIERSIVIQAPARLVYEQLAKLENLNNWAVWTKQDPAARYDLSGIDGTVGAASSWSGDAGVSGDGKIEIRELDPGKKIVHSIYFLRPKKRNASSVFLLTETQGVTSLNWNFEMATPRPWNIFNLFFSMDKAMGKDFEEGLASLKKIVETKNGVPDQKEYEVSAMNFPATSFAIIRQQVKWMDIPAFFRQHFPLLYEEAVKAHYTAGTAAGLFYLWDEKNQQADMAAAIPVPAGSSTDNPIINIVDIPASKAVYVNYSGAYDKIAQAYNSIKKYLAVNKLRQKFPSVEQYIRGPFTEKDTSKWMTKIVFLVE